MENTASSTTQPAGEVVDVQPSGVSLNEQRITALDAQAQANASPQVRVLLERIKHNATAVLKRQWDDIKIRHNPPVPTPVHESEVWKLLWAKQEMLTKHAGIARRKTATEAARNIAVVAVQNEFPELWREIDQERKKEASRKARLRKKADVRATQLKDAEKAAAAAVAAKNAKANVTSAGLGRSDGETARGNVLTLGAAIRAPESQPIKQEIKEEPSEGPGDNSNLTTRQAAPEVINLDGGNDGQRTTPSKSATKRKRGEEKTMASASGKAPAKVVNLDPDNEDEQGTDRGQRAVKRQHGEASATPAVARKEPSEEDYEYQIQEIEMKACYLHRS